MTLKEIARLAGVSPSTVSRVLNQPDSSAASPETRERIWKIIRETGYQPNQNARILRMGSTAPTGQSICCIFARSDEMMNDPFFSRIARAMEQECFRRGYIVRYSLSARQLNTASLHAASDYRVDGAVVLGRLSQRRLQLLQSHYRHLVYVGLNPIEANLDQIICSGYDAARAAMEHLISLGHREIAYLGEIDHEVRYQGYCDALSAHRLPRGPVVEIPLSADGGYRGGLRLNSLVGVTAAFCANDQCAIGAVKALREKGISIPQALSVISIDDIEIASYVTPMLTTIHIPTEEMGRQAARTLMERMEGERRLPVRIQVPFSLTRRESCGPPCPLPRPKSV